MSRFSERGLRLSGTLIAATLAAAVFGVIEVSANTASPHDPASSSTPRARWPSEPQPQNVSAPAEARVPDPAPATRGPGTVLLTGDSLMAQTLTELARPANRQANAPAFVMAAEGGSGLFELDYWLARLETLVGATEPDAVVISWGTNSATEPDVVASYAERAGELLDVVGAVPVLWYTPRTDYGFGTVEIGAQLAPLATERQHLEVRAMDELLADHPERSADDGIHLSWWGELAFAHDMLEWLNAHGLGDGEEKAVH